MKYAVVSVKGKQYRVSEGQEILLEGFDWAKEKTQELPEVLLVTDEKKVSVGTPTVKGAKVLVDVLGEEKGEKIDVRKYKAKSRYRRRIGHRAQFTRVKVNKIATA